MYKTQTYSYTKLNLELAYQELLSYWKEDGANPHPWGYFPYMNSEGYKECKILAEELTQIVPNNYELAFIGMLPANQDYDNKPLHLDTDLCISLGKDPRLDQGYAVQRLVLNLGTSPRIIEFENLSTNIPARESTSLHSIEFISSEHPHRGYNAETGFFIASYGSWVSLN